MDKNTNPRTSQSNIAPATQPLTAVNRPVAAAAAAGGAPQALPDLGALLRRVVAHWPVIVVTMVVGALVTAQVVRMRKPMYKSETVIFYREGIGKSVTGPTESGEAIRSLGTKLKETLLAQQTLRKLIDEFHLYPDIVMKSGYADAVDQMRKKTEFKSRSQDTFAISFEGVDRDQAQKVTARMADLLVTENARRLKEENKGTTEFLEIEKKRADEELDRVERDISEFLQAHPEFASAKEGLGTEVLASQKKLDEDRKRRQVGGAVRTRRGPVDEGLKGLSPAAVDPVLLATRTQAIQELAAARKELAEKSLKYTDDYPDVRTAKARVAAAEVALKHADEAIAAAAPPEPAPVHKKAPDDPYADPVPSSNPSAPKAAAGTGADKPKEEPKAKPTDPDQAVSLEIEWSRLGRALGLARTRQVDLEQKLYRAQMVENTAESGYGTTIAVLDPAFRPSGPSNAPNRTVVAVGLGASVAVGVVLSAAWGLFLDDRLFAPSEIETIVMVPVLGIVPRSKRKEKKGAADAKKGAARA